jgi:molybdate transport system ATP-binding protein
MTELPVDLAFDLTFTIGQLPVAVGLDAGSGPLALAGPSGAGKTSLLRAIAGLLRPDAGYVRCGRDTWFDAAARVWHPPERRSCGFVFQDYGLFPHLSAWQNVAFGVEGRPAAAGRTGGRAGRTGGRVSGRAGGWVSRGARRARRARAVELLERFGLAHLADEPPSTLSGGERQRVAIARALAREPSLLLFDEPLASLDPRSRAHAARELAAVVASAGVPSVLVTHDFAEAAALARDVAVIERGRLVQRGSPQELATAPASAFVADFTGASVLNGQVLDTGRLTVISLDGGGRIVSTEPAATGLRVAASVQPWDVTLEPAGTEQHGSAQNRLPARVVSLVPLGGRVRVVLATPQLLSAEVSEPARRALGLAPGIEVVATWKATATRLALL